MPMLCGGRGAARRLFRKFSYMPVQLVTWLVERILIKLPEKRPPNALTFPASYILKFVALLAGRFAEFWWLDSSLEHLAAVGFAALLTSIRSVTLLLMLPEAFCLRHRAFLLTLLLCRLAGS